MAPRLQLQSVLSGIDGVEKAYFQPPTNVRLQYPCIVYQKDSGLDKFADNGSYSFTQRYQVTVIDRDPDSAISDAVKRLPMCVFNRHFAADDLNHDVFLLYF